MLFTIAWRNIWRNKRRTLIVVSSVVVGVVALIMNDSLSIGMIQQMFENQLGSHVAHMQIHKRGFNDNKIIQSVVPDQGRVEDVLRSTPEVKHFSRRVVTFGLVSSAINSSGAAIIGVEPEREPGITIIKKSIIEGRYLSGASHEVVIGGKMAKKLSVEVGDKIVGMASTVSGSVGSDMFRVVGIYRTVSSEFDKSYVFISLKNAQEMLELGGNVSEFAIILRDRKLVEMVKNKIAGRLGPDYEVLSYADLMPLILAQMQMYSESMFIVYIIIGLALIFGIINSTLMSVFERMQEFGVLMAIGMKNSRLFYMIMLEALVIGVLGTAVGMVAGLVLYMPLSAYGLDLSMFSESLTSFGVGSTIYPVLTLQSVVGIMIVIPVFAVLGALYPALKAIRLEPVSAIRYV
ncbi:MAG: ABC transporter permease [Chlorobi bacterium]|nr:ABC transporter permease [Chlorobiota bacterium]